MGKNLAYSFLDCAKDMPPLYHTQPSKEFNVDSSEVVEWLLNQPQIKQKIFNMARNKGVITYNPESGMWKGVDYDD